MYSKTKLCFHSKTHWNGPLFWRLGQRRCHGNQGLCPSKCWLACTPLSSGRLVQWWTVVCVYIHKARVPRTAWTPWGAWMTPLREAIRYVRGTPVLRWTSSRWTGVHGELNSQRRWASRTALSTHGNYLSRLRLGLRLVKIHSVRWWIRIMTAQGSLPRRVSSCWTGLLTGSLIQGVLVQWKNSSSWTNVYCQLVPRARGDQMYFLGSPIPAGYWFSRTVWPIMTGILGARRNRFQQAGCGCTMMNWFLHGQNPGYAVPMGHGSSRIVQGTQIPLGLGSARTVMGPARPISWVRRSCGQRFQQESPGFADPYGYRVQQDGHGCAGPVRVRFQHDLHPGYTGPCRFWLQWDGRLFSHGSAFQQHSHRVDCDQKYLGPCHQIDSDHTASTVHG